MAGNGCRPARWTIPPSDGPFQLSVVYPNDQPLVVTDSISIWGTVGSGKARLKVNGQAIRVEPNGAFAAFLPLPDGGDPVLTFEARLRDSVLRQTIPIARSPGPAGAPFPKISPASGWVRLVRRSPVDTGDLATRSRPIYSRWTPGGTIAIPLPLGARLSAEAQTDSAIRVRISGGLAMWVSKLETRPDPGSSAVPLVRNVTVSEAGGITEVRVPLENPVPTTLDMVDGRLRWTLHGARVESAFEPAARGIAEEVAVRAAGAERVVIDMGLREVPYGWRVRWEPGALRLEIRPTPSAGPGLAGMVVALDPGHPPAGSTGPTGLNEAEVTMAVALATAERLERLGARPVLIRRDGEPVSLDRRVQLAEEADPDVFVSIHLNAPGDGRPPESVDETQVFWLYRPGLAVARHVRDSVAARLGVAPGLLVESNLVVLRSTWFPTVLVEATALVRPIREATFRTPAGIQAYAEGIVSGLVAWAALVERP